QRHRRCRARPDRSGRIPRWRRGTKTRLTPANASAHGVDLFTKEISLRNELFDFVGQQPARRDAALGSRIGEVPPELRALFRSEVDDLREQFVGDLDSVAIVEKLGRTCAKYF